LSLTKADIVEIKSLIKDVVEKEVKKAVDSKYNEDEIREIVAETLAKFYKMIFYKRNFWLNDIKKK
jgi:hypothetical protein